MVTCDNIVVENLSQVLLNQLYKNAGPKVKDSIVTTHTHSPNFMVLGQLACLRRICSMVYRSLQAYG